MKDDGCDKMTSEDVTITVIAVKLFCFDRLCETVRYTKNNLTETSNVEAKAE